MGKNKNRNKAANTAPVTPTVTTPETPVTTEAPTASEELSTNKEFIISDINGIEIGKKVLTAEGNFIEESFTVEVKRVDGTVYVPTEDLGPDAIKYIEFEDTDGALRFSPEPENEPEAPISDAEKTETPENTQSEPVNNLDEAKKIAEDNAPTEDTPENTEDTEEEVVEKTPEDQEKEDKSNADKVSKDKKAAKDLVEKVKNKIPDTNPFKLSVVKLLDEVLEKI